MSGSRTGAPEYLARRSAGLVLIALLGTAPGAASADGSGGTVRLTVSDPVTSDRIRSLPGSRLAADYGAFQLLEVDASVAPGLVGLEGVEERPDLDVVVLNAARLSTAGGAAGLAPIAAFEGRRLHLVQLSGPVRPEWLEELTSLGLELVDHVPSNAYLVYGSHAALREVRRRLSPEGPLRWDGAYEAALKIAPQATAARTVLSGEPAAYSIQLVLDPEANAVTRALIESARNGPGGSEHAVRRYVDLVAPVPREALAAIAARPDVISIHPWSPPEPACERQGVILSGRIVDSGGGWTPASPGYLAWLRSLGFSQEQFTASGFVVDVVDSGIDNGTTRPNHPGLFVGGDPGQGSRVAYSRVFGTPGRYKGKGCDGHGTINAHIVAGYDDSRQGPPRQDAAGYHPGLGICPFVKVGSSVVFDPDFTAWNGDLDYAAIFSSAWRDGARISSNSWGQDTYGGYNAVAQVYDMLVRDAQPETAGNQEMVVVVAAGNRGPSRSTVDSPGGAKNVISVGASRNVNPFAATKCRDDGEGAAEDANGIAFFSGRGPTTDGRFKPDLVAPGTHVNGGVIQVADPPASGKADPCFDATGVCGGPKPGGYWPLDQQLYTASSGTSHSTPAVAGAAALVRQDFLNRAGQAAPGSGRLPGAPSPALTRALLVSSARFLTGLGPEEKLPSTTQGMGLLDLGKLFDRTPRVVVDQSPLDTFTATGQSRTYAGTVSDPARPFRVTMAFTDAPGSTVGDPTGNDLDLVVTVGGVTYRGNVFEGRTSAPGGTADRRNTVESVFLPAGVSGRFVVSVVAANVAVAAVPGGPGIVNQDFALVVTNAVETPLPVVEAVAATLSEESCVPANGSADPGEPVSYDVTLRNVGSLATTDLVARVAPRAPILDADDLLSFGVVPPGASATRPLAFRLPSWSTCGRTVSLPLRLRDGSRGLGTVAFPLAVGTPTRAPSFLAGTGELHVPIPARGSVDVPLGVKGAGATVESLTARVRIQHPRDLDLTLTLIGPDGTAVVLAQFKGKEADFGTGAGCDGDPTVFDDGARLGLGESLAPFAGPHRPVEALAAFRGRPLDGTWTLRVASDELPGEVLCFQLEAQPRQSYCCGVAGTPRVVASGSVLAGEACTPANGAADPGERVTVELGLEDQGTAPAPSLSARLREGGGVVSPDGQKLYGVLVPGAGPVARPFTFTVDPAWPCGEELPVTAVLSTGGAEIGTAMFAVPTGTRQLLLAEGFDGLVPPALPAGWTATGSAGASAWVTSDLRASTPPNAAWVPDSAGVSEASLSTPPVLVNAEATRLGFALRTAFLFTKHWVFGGAVLEVSLDGGPFQDVLEAGGTFATGAYDGRITESASPLDGRAAWTRASDGFFPVAVDLPASFLGRLAVFRFRVGCTGGRFIPAPGGLFVDDVRLEGRPRCCGSGPACTLLSAEAVATPTIGAPPLPVQFQASVLGDGCSGRPDLVWSFGDGSPVERGASVRHVYTARGDHAWTMTAVWDGATLRRGGSLRVEAPVLGAAGQALAAEGCVPPNGAVDPGEAVTVALSLKNTGNAATGDLVAELLPAGGVVAPGAAVSFGAVPPDGTVVTRSFPFTASADLACGGTLQATLRLTDGARALGTLSFPFAVGSTGPVTLFSDTFPSRELPGWAVEQLQGTTTTWRPASSGEGPVEPRSPPTMVRFTSTRAAEEDSSSLRQTRGFDPGGTAESSFTLRYWVFCPAFSAGNLVFPEVSSDGGLTWEIAGPPAACGYQPAAAWVPQSASVSRLVAGRSDVRLGFRGINADLGDVNVDDVTLETEAPLCCGPARRGPLAGAGQR